MGPTRAACSFTDFIECNFSNESFLFKEYTLTKHFWKMFYKLLEKATLHIIIAGQSRQSLSTCVNKKFNKTVQDDKQLFLFWVSSP